MRLHGLVVGCALLTASFSLSAQMLQVDRGSAVSRAALRLIKVDTPRSHLTTGADSVARPRRSRGAATALGFLAGAAGGLVLAHLVNQRHQGDGRLEAYLAVPPMLGFFTAATVFIAMGD